MKKNVQTKPGKTPHFLYLAVISGLLLFLSVPCALHAQDFFYIPDQNASHNTKALAIGAGATPPATGTQDDNGTVPNTNLGPFYTSTNIGVKDITGVSGPSSFTLPSANNADQIQTSCVLTDPTSGFQNAMIAGNTYIIQVVIQKKAALTANLGLHCKIYALNAGTATPATLIASTLLIDANFGTLTTFNGDLPKSSGWTYDNGTFSAATQFAYKYVPTLTSDPDADFIVLRFKWSAPTSGDHYCLFAMIEEDGVSNGEASWVWSNRDAEVKSRDNVAWRNLSVNPKAPVPPAPPGGEADKGASLMAGNPSQNAETMVFVWKPTQQMYMNMEEFLKYYYCTLDISNLPRDQWPNINQIGNSNYNPEIVFDSVKGVFTLNSPEIRFPEIVLRPNEFFHFRFGLHARGRLPDKYLSYSSLFEQYLIDKTGKMILVGGQEILVVNNVPVQQKRFITLQGGYDFPQGSLSTGYSPHFLGEIKAGYLFQARFGAQVHLGYYSLKGKAGNNNTHITGGGLGAFYYYPLTPGQGWKLIVELNGGYYKPDKVDGALGFNSGLGLNTSLTPHMALVLEGKYYNLFTKPDNINFFGGTVGLKFYF